jgi:hypothetical protein
LLLERPTAAAAAPADSAANANAKAEAERERNQRVRAVYDELARRLTAEPGIVGVTYAGRLPGTNQDETRVEIDNGSGAAEPVKRSDGSLDTEATEPGRRVRFAKVGVNFVETFQAPILAGRTFTEADLAPGRHVAVVDQTFVKLVLGGRHAIGRRVRDAERNGKPAGPWIDRDRWRHPRPDRRNQ